MIPKAQTDKHYAQLLGKLKQRYENGDKTVILVAIQQCLLMKRPLPEWLCEAFLQAYDTATGYEIRSWDEAFGAPHPKGTHLGKERRVLYLRGEIVARVRELQAAGSPVDKGLFETIGQKLGLSGTTASDIYYDKRTEIVRHVFETLNRPGKN
jgi:hypothetical protein